MLIFGWTLLAIRPRLVLGSGELLRTRPPPGARLRAACLGRSVRARRVPAPSRAVLFAILAGAIGGAFAFAAVVLILLIIILFVIASVPVAMAIGGLILRGDRSPYLAYLVGAAILAAIVRRDGPGAGAGRPRRSRDLDHGAGRLRAVPHAHARPCRGRTVHRRPPPAKIRGRRRLLPQAESLRPGAAPCIRRRRSAARRTSRRWWRTPRRAATMAGMRLTSPPARLVASSRRMAAACADRRRARARTRASRSRCRRSCTSLISSSGMRQLLVRGRRSV